jgi:hypothetical protein
MKIYDVCGKEVRSITISSNETSIDRGELQDGLYFYSIMNDDKSMAKGKLVIH